MLLGLCAGSRLSRDGIWRSWRTMSSSWTLASLTSLKSKVRRSWGVPGFLLLQPLSATLCCDTWVWRGTLFLFSRSLQCCSVSRGKSCSCHYRDSFLLLVIGICSSAAACCDSAPITPSCLVGLAWGACLTPSFQNVTVCVLQIMLSSYADCFKLCRCHVLRQHWRKQLDNEG